MKTKTMSLYKLPSEAEAGIRLMELREAVALPGVGLTIPVRAAKAKLSALLELVAGGQEVTITSDGVPKAVLSPVGKKIFAKSVHRHLGAPEEDAAVARRADGRGNYPRRSRWAGLVSYVSGFLHHRQIAGRRARQRIFHWLAGGQAARDLRAGANRSLFGVARP